VIFVDTNYFLRFLLNDVSSQQETAKKLFKQGSEGKVKLFTSTIVFFELYWVFTSFYKKSKPQVVKILNDILSLSFIKIKERKILETALTEFGKTNLELEDCYNLVYAQSQGAKKIDTFDQKLAKKIDTKI
jgi:predicted nucleic-acid-binding protein